MFSRLAGFAWRIGAGFERGWKLQGDGCQAAVLCFARGGWSMVVTWDDALRDLGRKRLRQAVRRGELIRAFPRLYAEPGALGPWEHELAAACLWAGQNALASFTSAANLHGLDLPGRCEIELTVPREQNPVSKRVKVHRCDVPPRERRKVRGIPCTSLAWTVLDLAARIDDVLDLAILVESAWRKKPTDFLEWMTRVLDEKGAGRRGIGRLWEVLAECRTREKPLRSAYEVRFWRYLLARRGEIPLPVPGLRVEDCRGELEIDFAWRDQDLAVETDGRGTHDGWEAVVRDKQRTSRLAAIGWRVMQIPESDFRNSAETVFGDVKRALAHRTVRTSAAWVPGSGR